MPSLEGPRFLCNLLITSSWTRQLNATALHVANCLRLYRVCDVEWCYELLCKLVLRLKGNNSTIAGFITQSRQSWTRYSALITSFVDNLGWRQNRAQTRKPGVHGVVSRDITWKFHRVFILISHGNSAACDWNLESKLWDDNMRRFYLILAWDKWDEIEGKFDVYCRIAEVKVRPKVWLRNAANNDEKKIRWWKWHTLAASTRSPLGNA